MSKTLFILNGPNLNRLGRREPEIYGRHTLDDVRQMCVEKAQSLGFAVDFRQTNSEGELVNHVQDAADGAAALLLNPAGYGHTSIALHDALKLVEVPIIEVHLSNPAAREAFRATSYVSPLARGLVSGFGIWSYVFGVDAAARLVAEGSV